MAPLKGQQNGLEGTVVTALCTERANYYKGSKINETTPLLIRQI